MMRHRQLVAGMLSAVLAAGPAVAQVSACGLCATEVVMTPPLAACLLSQYDMLATADDGGAIAVDLTGCEQERGIVEALPSVAPLPREPDLRFLVSRSQLDCLKTRIEAPGSVQAPASTIDLNSCQ
jgi:hypothetical protein